MVTKKSIKDFLKLIRAGDHQAAKKALKAMPELAHATCSPPPAKYEGQTLLQIAVRNAVPKIVVALVDAGADVNYIEETTVNDWNSPVLNDAVHSAVLCTIGHDHRTLKEIIKSIRRLLEEGANPKLKDTRGQNAFARFIDTVKQRTDDVYFISGITNEPLRDNDTTKRAAYLREIYDLLLEFGAKPSGLGKLTNVERERAGF